MLLRVITYFLPPGPSGSVAEQRQTRTIVTTVALTSLFSLNFLLLCWWANFWPGLWLMVFNAGTFVVLLFAFRAGLFSTRVLGYLYLAVGYLGVFLNCVYQGGYYAATTPWLVLCPVTGAFLLGRRGALTAGAVALLSIVGLWELARRGVALPHSVPAGKLHFWHLDIMLGLLLILVVVALTFDRIYATTLGQLTEKNVLLAERTEQLEQALDSLRVAQAQLVHSEKMAALGELLAGIAHEIQNPLNFINNYAEVSNELLHELSTASPTEAPQLLATLTRNLDAVTRHGRRAGTIVHDMLQHAQSGPRERQPTSLNQLVAEYLPLAYAGQRARDPTFEAHLTTHLDPQLGEVSAVTADLGRVLLNLLTNAFHATAAQRRRAGGPYQPHITVSTHRRATEVEVRVQDNGCGMAEAVRRRVFEPFYTTKPTGEGTGLGLSLSYDIVVRGHGGQLLVTSQEGEGSEFRLLLPG